MQMRFSVAGYICCICILLSIAAGTTTPRPVTNRKAIVPAKSPPDVGPVIRQCFHEGRWYPAGSLVHSGQSADWCYVSYCAFDGKVKYWDNYNCPPTQKGNVLPTTQPLPVTSPPPSTTTTPWPLFTFPPPSSTSNQYGCWYRGRYYLPGSDIENRRRGSSCYGVYCDYNSRVMDWQDSCYNTVAPFPATTVDWT